MITLTFTETVFWALILLSLPIGFFLVLKFSYIISDVKKLESKIERLSNFTDGLSDRIHEIEIKED